MRLQNIDRVCSSNWKYNFIEEYFYLDGISTKFGAVTYVEIREKKGLRLQKIRHKRHVLECVIFNIIKLISYLTLFIPIGVAIAKKKYRISIEKLKFKLHVNNNLDKLGPDIQKNILSYLSIGEGLTVCREWNNQISEIQLEKYKNEIENILNVIISTLKEINKTEKLEGINLCIKELSDLLLANINNSQYRHLSLDNSKSSQHLFELKHRIRDQIIDICELNSDVMDRLKIALDSIKNKPEGFQNLVSLMKLKRNTNLTINFKTIDECFYSLIHPHRHFFIYNSAVFNVLKTIIEPNEIDYALRIINTKELFEKNYSISNYLSDFFIKLIIKLIQNNNIAKVKELIDRTKKIKRNFDIVPQLLLKQQYQLAKKCHFKTDNNKFNIEYFDRVVFAVMISKASEDTLHILNDIIDKIKLDKFDHFFGLFQVLKTILRKNHHEIALRIINKFSGLKKQALLECYSEEKGNHELMNSIMSKFNITIPESAKNRSMSLRLYVYRTAIKALIENQDIITLKKIVSDISKPSFIYFIKNNASIDKIEYNLICQEISQFFKEKGIFFSINEIT